MIYLLLAIGSSVLVSLMMRLSGSYAKNNNSMLAVNYFVCMLLAAGYTGFGTLFQTGEGLGAAIGIGFFAGCLYLGSFLLFQWNIPQNGLGISTTFMKLGVLVPVVASVVIFRETPKLIQLLGLAAAILAIVLLYKEDGKGAKTKKWALLALLLVNGGADVASKFYEQLGTAAFKNHFLFYTFLTAAILSALLAVVSKQKIGRWEVLFGALVGLPNYFSARFLLLSLSDVPSVVAFPTYSVAAIMIVLLLGRALFQEKLQRRQILAVIIILAALVLLNL